MIKRRIIVLSLVGLLAIITVSSFALNQNLRSSADTIDEVKFIANKVNHFRYGAKAGYMEAGEKLIYNTPMGDAPIDNPYYGAYVFTIDSYQSTTEWLSFEEVGFTFTGLDVNDGTTGTVQIKVSDRKRGNEAAGSYLPAVRIGTRNASFVAAGQIPKGRYATIKFMVNSRIHRNIEFSRLYVTVNAYQINCPKSKKPIPATLTYNAVPGCFGDHGSKLVTSNLIYGMTFKGREITQGIHRAMVPKLLAAENLIYETEELTGKNYEVRTTSDSYNNRVIKDPSGNPTGKWSTHAWGVAIDFNAVENGFVWRSACQKPRDPENCPRDMPDYFANALESQGLFWGGRFSDRCDVMHFQMGGDW